MYLLCSANPFFLLPFFEKRPRFISDLAQSIYGDSVSEFTEVYVYAHERFLWLMESVIDCVYLKYGVIIRSQEGVGHNSTD